MDIHQFLNQTTLGSNLPSKNFFLEQITSDLAAPRNIALVAHPGWGKTALLREVGFKLTEQNKNIRVLYFDLKGIYSKATFIRRIIQELYITFSAKIPNNLNLMEPDISMLDQTETLASRRKVRLIIFISNFQQFDRFDDRIQLLTKLKFCWRKQKSCTYCISGNNRHFFQTYFNEMGTPFSHFARLYYQKRDIVGNYISYVKGLFFSGGKMINRDAAVYISTATEGHLHYLQILSWNAYLRTDHSCTVPIAEAAFKCMILQYEPYMEHTLEQLTEKQFNYLRALLSYSERICSRETLKEYNLGESGNVARIKNNLVKKGILEVNREFIEIVDPLFKYWLEQLL